MTKQQKLELLKDKLVSANPVPELADGARQIVFGSGNADADIVFVGEAPGKKEDELGMPFVGASGKFLDEMLAHTGLNRHDVYITNIVKFRPPENRDPTLPEKEAFWPYLLEEILIIKPKIIATLGRHSGQAFIKSLRIGVDHGKPQRAVISFSPADNSYGVEIMHGDDEQRTEPYIGTVKGVAQSATKQKPAKGNSASNFVDGQVALSVSIVPLYHPAAALYNGSLRQTLLDDFTIVNKIIK